MLQQVTLNARPQDAYHRQGVLTASPLELIVMLYDGLKKNLLLGKRAISKRDVPNAHRYLMKSQAIVTELINCLDMSYQISEELFELYDFILRSVREANISKDASMIDPIVEIVEDLRSAWYEISMSSRGELHMREEQA